MKMKTNIKMMKILLVLLLMRASFSYVMCPDELSACADGQRCCAHGTGYRCCPYNYICSPDGTMCYNGDVARTPKIFISKTPSAEPKRMEKKITKFSSEIVLLSVNNNSSLVAQNLKNDNAVSGLLKILDSFLNTTEFYRYARYTQGCKDEISKVLFNVIEEISILNNKTLVSNPTQFMIEFTYTLSQIVTHSKYMLQNCRYFPDEMKQMLNLTIEYASQPGYVINVVENLEEKYPLLMNYLSDIKIQWNNEKYPELGVTLGLLFNNIFRIKEN